MLRLMFYDFKFFRASSIFLFLEIFYLNVNQRLAPDLALHMDLELRSFEVLIVILFSDSCDHTHPQKQSLLVGHIPPKA